ncbi:hypothetical protein BDN72DRAFT_907548 [Pluteus cervinus]|uniref:Uncharacterized protein n=1 Tax=Pluteus cervinus TaxID=181527 RepID=A0ACD2ZWK1_9AGAR|nr:hypothetical protein BDN72DRAFT_907548 [Pluteus cervinus]
MRRRYRSLLKNSETGQTFFVEERTEVGEWGDARELGDVPCRRTGRHPTQKTSYVENGRPSPLENGETFYVGSVARCSTLERRHSMSENEEIFYLENEKTLENGEMLENRKAFYVEERAERGDVLCRIMERRSIFENGEMLCIGEWETSYLKNGQMLENGEAFYVESCLLLAPRLT